jgi:hypothetical protein
MLSIDQVDTTGTLPISHQILPPPHARPQRSGRLGRLDKPPGIATLLPTGAHANTAPGGDASTPAADRSHPRQPPRHHRPTAQHDHADHGIPAAPSTAMQAAAPPSTAMQAAAPPSTATQPHLRRTAQHDHADCRTVAPPPSTTTQTATS